MATKRSAPAARFAHSTCWKRSSPAAVCSRATAVTPTPADSPCPPPMSKICGSLFSRYGGHSHACGFAMPSANVEDLRAKLDAFARTRLTLADFDPILDLDAERSEEHTS